MTSNVTDLATCRSCGAMRAIPVSIGVDDPKTLEKKARLVIDLAAVYGVDLGLVLALSQAEHPQKPPPIWRHLKTAARPQNAVLPSRARHQSRKPPRRGVAANGRSADERLHDGEPR